MILPKTNDTKTIKKPLILIPTGARVISDLPYQLLAKKYSDPIVRFSDCTPLLVPTCYGYAQLEQYLDLADGVYLSGASTNIVPAMYGEENQTPNVLQDPDRDYFDAQLIPAGLERGLPDGLHAHPQDARGSSARLQHGRAVRRAGDGRRGHERPQVP